LPLPSPRPARVATLISAAAALLLAPAPALAAYAPGLDVKIAPTTPSTPPAVTSTITQAATETASKKVVVSFPAGFTAPTSKLGVTACSADQQSTRTCGAESRIGTAAATAAVLGLPVDLAGSVHYGGPEGRAVKLIVYLDNDSLNQHLTVVGLVTIRSTDFGFDATFDNLPNTTTTSFTLALDGGDRSLATTPKRCGTYTFVGRFVSQSGETAESRSSVTIAGCPKVAPSVGRLELSATRVRPGTGVKFGFFLSEPARVRVVVKGGPKNRKVLDRSFDADEGDTTFKRFGKALGVGRYRIAVTAVDEDGQTATRKASFRVVPRPRR